ncbi:hypothetical protein [Pedobacter duraquae]|uniref:Uncharacterized protein n=1 Tax=Pedobacter duraquae TaxID=425511 RepID=A0A4R6IGT3_9SPHI|nr:hypothetical protein [Pedobacter duraquae]TDO20917.1 hypothetical protein CLV32_3553 [Pedobacter duraquae]
MNNTDFAAIFRRDEGRGCGTLDKLLPTSEQEVWPIWEDAISF